MLILWSRQVGLHIDIYANFEYYHNNPFYISKMPDGQSETYLSSNSTDIVFGYWGHSHARAPVSTGLSQYALYYRAGLVSPRLHNGCLLALNSCSSSFLNLFCLIILSLSKLLPDALKLGTQTRFLTHTHTLSQATATVQFWAEEPRLSLRGVKGIWDKRITPYCHINTESPSASADNATLLFYFICQV